MSGNQIRISNIINAICAMDPAKHFPLIILFPVGHQRLRMSCIVFS